MLHDICLAARDVLPRATNFHLIATSSLFFSLIYIFQRAPGGILIQNFNAECPPFFNKSPLFFVSFSLLLFRARISYCSLRNFNSRNSVSITVYLYRSRTSSIYFTASLSLFCRRRSLFNGGTSDAATRSSAGAINCISPSLGSLSTASRSRCSLLPHDYYWD